MPRTLDVEARDRAVVDAAWRVIVREGLAGLSVRALAAEAGLPPSSLRTTFPTQAGARRAALVEALRQQQRRLEVASAPRELLIGLLPLDERRREEAAVLLALRSSALVDPALVDLREEADEVVLRACEEAARRLGAEDPLLVQVLHAALDGLVLQLLQDRAAEGRVLAVLDRLLASVRSPREAEGLRADGSQAAATVPG